MAEAVRIGEGARGQSAPNPNVGCVIAAASGRIVGKAATAGGGRPHAEQSALEQAGRRAAGSTVYVTLEPCAHASDRGPACTDLLLEAKPERMVIALKDPDPRTAGKGIRRLRAAGIEITLGMEREAVDGWETLESPQDVYRLHDVNDLLVEGGSATATAFLSEDLVDRILIYRAPIIVGEGKSSFGYVGLDAIADAHGRWRLVDEQRLGVDRLEVYERAQES